MRIKNLVDSSDCVQDFLLYFFCRGVYISHQCGQSSDLCAGAMYTYLFLPKQNLKTQLS